MRYIIEAYDENDRQVLGNLDGQVILTKVRNYRLTKHYKSLRTRRTLYNRVKYYNILKVLPDSSTKLVEVVQNETHRPTDLQE